MVWFPTGLAQPNFNCCLFDIYKQVLPCAHCKANDKVQILVWPITREDADAKCCNG